MTRGAVLIQRHDPSVFRQEFTVERGTSRFTVRDITTEPGRVTGAVLEYRVDGQVWTQTVRVQELDESALRDCLADAALQFDCYLTDDETWIRALPA